MNNATEDKIYKAFPMLYRKRLEWGFECEDGWYDIIVRLSGEIVTIHNKKYNDDYPCSIQVKQKFGALIWYGYFLDEEMNNAISKYTSLSLKTCELCGNNGELLIRNRIRKVRCSEHSEL